MEIKIDAFPYTKYGLIDGEVSNISRDSIEDEKQGLVYPARIRLLQTTVNVRGKAVSLAPGMRVVVEIKTGNRRVIEFFSVAPYSSLAGKFRRTLNNARSFAVNTCRSC